MDALTIPSKSHPNIVTEFRIEDRSNRVTAKVLGYTHIITKYLVMTNEPDDYLYTIYRGSEQQCKDWLRTMHHQGRLK